MKTIHLFTLTITAGMMLVAATPLRAANADKSINNKIFHLLMNNRSLAKGSEKVTVITHDGDVTLSGDVVTTADKEDLHNAIAGVPGVHHVNDRQLISRSYAANGFGEGLP